MARNHTTTKPISTKKPDDGKGPDMESIANAVGNNGPQTSVDSDDQSLPPLINEAPMNPPAQVDETPKEIEPHKSYQVQRTRRAMANGHPTVLQEGKVISAGSYDIESLKQQGVFLKEI